MAIHQIEGPEPQPEPEPKRKPLTLDDLPIGEVEMIERKAGQSVTTLGNDNFPQAGLIAAVGWVILRRTEPDVRVTYEAYKASRTMNQIEEQLGWGDDGDEVGKRRRVDLIELASEHAKRKAQFCMATGVQPSEYAALTSYEIAAFVEVANKRSE